MQQTETYKLNLIETSDPFSPSALNENTRKIEEALQSHADSVDSRVDGLDERVKVFEAKKFAFGSYNASSSSDNLVSLDFTPYAVLIHYCSSGNGFAALALAEQNGEGVAIVENGFTTAVGSGFNIRSGRYTYIAIG